MSSFQIGQGAEKPSVAYGFLVDDGGANLTGAGSVTFRMRPANGTAATVNAAGTVTDATAGSVRYDWASGDTATAGDYAATFTVYFASGELVSPEFAVRVFPLVPAGAAHRHVRHLLDDSDAALFTDQDVTDALARHASVLIDEEISGVPQVRGGAGSVEWRVYPTRWAWLDEGVAMFDVTGATVSGWSLDAAAGRFTFAADTLGTAYFVSGTAYEPALAAADLADRLASRYAREYDFASDGASFSRSQRAQAWRDLARELRGQALRPGVATMVRTDSPC